MDMKMKTTIRDTVKEHASELRGLNSHGDLFKWSRAHGLDSQAGFSGFKKALKAELGIDYAALRGAAHEAKTEALEAAATASLTLITDAKARTDRFAVCDRNGNPVWFGKFFEDDRDYNGEQSSGEMAAAKKAVWLASKVKDALGAAAIRLTLKVDAEWLCYANAVAGNPMDNKTGGKARPLGELAQRYGIVLNIQHISGVSNPADKYTVCSGFKKWQDADLLALVDPAPTTQVS